MFVHDFVFVDRSMARVRSQLIDCGDGWIHETGGSKLRVGPKKGRFSSKAVHVFVGRPHEYGSAIRIPISWVASGASGLFPSIEADLELWPIDDENTKLSLSGMYEPPLGSVGKVIDKAVLHHVAEATIREFLSNIAETLSKEGTVAQSGWKS